MPSSYPSKVSKSGRLSRRTAIPSRIVQQLDLLPEDVLLWKPSSLSEANVRVLRQPRKTTTTRKAK